VGCETETETPDWSVRFASFAVDGWVHARTPSARAEDGTFAVGLNTHAGNRVQVGEQELAGPQLIRVSAEGAVLKIIAASDTNPTALRVDSLGNIVVLGSGPNSLVSYDRDLDRQWTQSVDYLFSWTPFDVSPQGTIALVSKDETTHTSTIHALNPDGTTAWESTQLEILDIKFARNGDLFAFGHHHRWHYDSTGALLDDLDIPWGVAVADEDGGWILALPPYEPTVLLRYDRTGTMLWSQTVEDEISAGGIFIAETGHIVVPLWSFASALVISPAGSGHRSDSLCANSGIVASDAEHCFGFGRGGLSQFAPL
jgi:hypothetical protein